MLNKFISYLEEQVKNHSIYVWGAQGQQGSAITESWIRKRETSDKNAARAIAFWKKQCEAGYTNLLRAFDCSGLGVCFLLENGLIKSDMTANGFMGKCAKIAKDDLRIGDFVFKTNSSNRATHIGYVVDNELNIIEAKGRDYGVIKSKLSDWDVYGRPSYWTEDEVTKLQGKEPAADNPQGFIFTRVLKYGVSGDDVCELKRLLAAAGFRGLELNNKNFYTETKNTVKAFQTSRRLAADGIAGPITIKALGGRWDA